MYIKQGRRREVPGFQKSGVEAFATKNARVSPQTPVELRVPDIHRMDHSGSPLKQAIGKPSSGGADINTDEP